MKYNRITEATLDYTAAEGDELHGFCLRFAAGEKGVTSIHAYDEGVAVHFDNQDNLLVPWRAVHNLRYT